MKCKILISTLMFMLACSAQATNEDVDPSEGVKAHVCQCSQRRALEIQDQHEVVQEGASQTEVRYMTFEELIGSFKAVSHPDVFALFEEGFGVLFEHQEMRIPAKRENHHITCLREKFTLALQQDPEPMTSQSVRAAQMEALSKVLNVKGHSERLSGEFIEKLQ
ncbi:MAG: hypothetical protein H2057_00965 [Alphaproteobacteria bacterium]|nr:hypothetical protein [Alphaproteobacteria bacterium]